MERELNRKNNELTGEVHRIIECDESGVIRGIHPCMGTVAGICASEIIGKNILSDFKQCAIDAFSPYFEKVKSKMVPLHFDEQSSQCSCKGFPPGVLIPRQLNDVFTGFVYVLDNISTIPKSKGELDKIEREKVYDALKASEERFSFMVENLFLGFVVTKFDGEIVYMNDYIWKMHGYGSSSEFKQVSALDLWYDSVARDKFADEVMSKGSVKNFEAKMYKKSGEVLTVLINGYMSVDTLYAVVLDISERKAAEEELRESKESAELANRFKDHFISMVGHDVRTPLNSIMASTDLLAESDLNASDKECVRILQSASDSLLNIADDIYDLATVCNGDLKVKLTSINVRELVEKNISIFNYIASEKGLKLTYSIDSVVPESVLSDMHYLSRILSNLIDNAIKFTADGGVYVNVGFSSGELLISVYDTGIGVHKDLQSSLYQEFYYNHRVDNINYCGSGVGLFMCNKLALLLGGCMDMESDSGHGSRFTAVIPVSTDYSSVQRDWNGLIVGDKLRSGISVVVIDDSEANLAIAKLLLDGHDIDVKFFISPEDACEFCTQKDRDIDLILTDLQMPDMDGYTLVSHLRKWEDDNSITPVPVIALSASIFNDDIDRAIAVGCNGHISKPIRKKTFISSIVETLRNYS